MKTMTCKQMGGPCDAPIQGETAEEMLNNCREHVHSMDDEGHKKVVVQMEEIQKNPEEAKKWNDEFISKFNELPF